MPEKLNTPFHIFRKNVYCALVRMGVLKSHAKNMTDPWCLDREYEAGMSAREAAEWAAEDYFNDRPEC